MKKIFVIVILSAVFAACNNKAKEEALAKEQAIVAIRDSLKLDSFKKADLAAQQRLAEEKHQAALAATTNYTSSGRSTSTNGGTATVNKKKGWSDAAKGTAIGAGVGALGGILIDKKDGRGAIIGGLAGAGAGYAIGRAQDRKSGRVQKKN
ncbi:MAG: YMGG-like glycine zipper-containing protein [Bacteroidota bacterium]